MNGKNAKFSIGAIVRHRLYPFRGVVVDVDPEFDNSEEWYNSIPAEHGQKKTSLSIICWPKMPIAITPPM